jgi:hypothetical protein
MSSDEAPAGETQEDVRRLEIAVDDPLAVRGAEGAGHGARDPGRSLGRELAHAPEEIGERLALEQLHHQEGVASLGLADVVDLDDVGVPQAPAEPGLAEHARAELGVRIGDELERDLPVGAVVDRRPHLTHRADTDVALKEVLSGDEIPGVHGHGRRRA